MEKVFTFHFDFWNEHPEFIEKISKDLVEITLKQSHHTNTLETDGKGYYQVRYSQGPETKVESCGDINEIVQWFEHCDRVDDESYKNSDDNFQKIVFKYYRDKNKEFLKLLKDYVTIKNTEASIES